MKTGVEVSGHTPGPWTLTHVAGNNFAVQEFEVRGMFGDSPNVCPIFNKGPAAIYGATIFVSPEDGRLIAAAPDLLAACQAAKAHLIGDLVEPGRTVFWQLVAAIKKAGLTP